MSETSTAAVCPFTPEQVAAMRARLPTPCPNDGETVRSHVEHGLWQMLRFTHLARLGHAFRAMQYGLNLGRVQELLGSYGGKGPWWQAFEGPIAKGDYDRADAVVRLYLDLLGIGTPPAAFLERV